MWLAVIAFVVGLAVLAKSADLFVGGAGRLATRFGMPPFLVGMLVVGFGTSAPELLVSAQAATAGSPEMALGNAFGSNVANIGLILGLTALWAPLAVHSRLVRRELPWLAGATLLVAGLSLDGALSRLDAAVLAAAFAGLVIWMLWQSRSATADPLVVEAAEAAPEPRERPGRSVLETVAGLLLLLASARLAVWAAVEIATTLGIDELIVGLTVVAVGTSLPELASSLVAARRGAQDLALGNVVGSNLFNTLAVIGLAGALQPIAVPREVLVRDLPVVGAATIALFLVALGWRRQGRIHRWEGALLIAGYLAYVAVLVVS